MIPKHVWSAGPYAYTHTVRPYAYGRTVRVYVYGPDRTRTVQILIWSGTYIYINTVIIIDVHMYKTIRKCNKIPRVTKSDNAVIFVLV